MCLRKEVELEVEFAEHGRIGKNRDLRRRVHRFGDGGLTPSNADSRNPKARLDGFRQDFTGKKYFSVDRRFDFAYSIHKQLKYMI